eukprot:scaffold9319_cov192-Skeletonema_marinoi.AAC.1
MVGFSLKAEVVFQVLVFRMCRPFEIHTSFDQILFCYIEIIFDALVLFVWRLIQRMALSWQLIKVSSSKYKRIRSNKPRSPSSWKLLVLTLMSYPQLVVAPQNTPASACSDSSVSMITAVVLVMIATAVSSCAIIMSGNTHRRRAPRLKEASPGIMKQHRADCRMRQIVPMIRCKSSRSTSRKLLVLLLLSYPALVAAPHTSSSVGASSLSTSTSVAAASVGIGAICYAHRTRKWTRDESRLEEKCRQSGVMYTPPESNENEQDQNKRRSRLAEECRMEQSKRRRIKNADAQKKKRKSETPAEKKRRNEQNAQNMKEQRESETPEKRQVRKEQNAQRMKEQRESETPEKRQNQRHRAIGCVVCDEFIIGTEQLCSISRDQLLAHKDRLGVESYAEFHGEMDEILQKQYEISGLEGILLSPRFGKDNAKQFTVCSRCKEALKIDCITNKSPPKYAIANGFAIGTIPETIEFKGADDEQKSTKTVIEHRDGD